MNALQQKEKDKLQPEKNNNIVIMGLLNNILDRFNKTELTVAPNKKLKSISLEFKSNFDLTLVFYKGSAIADATMTLAALDKRPTKNLIRKQKG